MLCEQKPRLVRGFCFGGGLMADARAVLVKWWPMAVLCSVASSVWMVVGKFPGAGSTLSSGMVGCLLGAVVLGVVGWDERSGEWLWAAVGGAMVLAGPAMGMFVGNELLYPEDLALVLALTAVVVAVADGAMGEGELTGERLWPGLAATVGFLLVLPVPSIAILRNDVAMVLAPVVTGLGCVVFRRSKGVAMWKATLGLGGAAVVFGVGVAIQAGLMRSAVGISWAAVGMDGVLAALGVVALTRVSAEQYAARFVVVPLVVLVEGVVMLHMWVTWRVAACGLLLAVASVTLLRGGEEQGAAG